jgi:hypothetical protein
VAVLLVLGKFTQVALPGRFSTRSPSASAWRNAQRYRNFGARGSMAQARVASYPRPSFAPRELDIDASPFLGFAKLNLHRFQMPRK